MGFVLLIDPIAAERRRFCEVIGPRHTVLETADAAGAIRHLETSRVDVLVADVSPSTEELWGVVEHARSLESNLGIIVTSSTPDFAAARRALSAGASDFILKAWDNPREVEQLRRAIDHAADTATARHRAEAISSRIAHHRRYREPLLGSSTATTGVRQLVEMYRDASTVVLVEGPTGAGKEVVAKALHEASRFAQGPFVPVDLPTLVPELLAAELFGHVRGAYTDAPGSMGAFEAAEGGTLFLDEIGDVRIDQQAKLLRAIETREVQRVGSRKRIRLDLRIVAATNRNLRQMVADGTFREDLYYRLKQLHIIVPPLSERRGDIPVFVAHFLKTFSRKLGLDHCPTVSPEALSMLCDRPWQGNVRELKSFIERLMLTCQGDTLTGELVAGQLGSTARAHPDAHRSLRAKLRDYERHCITEALEKSGGNLRQAARLCGESFSTFYDRARRLGVVSGKGATPREGVNA